MKKRRRRRKKPIEITPKQLTSGEFFNNLNKLTDLSKEKEVYVKVVVKDSDDPEELHATGMAYMLCENWEKAVFHFEKALDLNPDLSEVYYQLGYCYVELDRHEEAVTFGTAALENSEEDKEKAHYVLGRAYIELDAFEKALYHFQQAHEIGLDQIDLDLCIGNTYGFLREYDLALEHLQKSLSKRPKGVRALNCIALVYLRLGQLDEADKYLADALSIDPDFVATKYNVELLKAAREKLEQKQEQEQK